MVTEPVEVKIYDFKAAMPHADQIIRRIPLPVSIRPAGRHVITDQAKLVTIDGLAAVMVEYGNYTAHFCFDVIV